MVQDTLLMSLVIFLPSVFAVGLFFFRKGKEEWMRWFALLGTAVTMVVSSFILIDYYNLLDSTGDSRPGTRAMHASAASLEARADAAAKSANAEDTTNRRDPKDYVSRTEWI